MALEGFKVHEVDSSSPNFKEELSQQLSELAPEIVIDGKIDLEKLRELISEDVDSTSERYGFYWPGKKRSLRVAQSPTTATLNPKKMESRNWESTGNLFIEGDNLEVLKVLQKHYHNKIKTIYIDPPYNTGNDFVYPDNFKEGIESYLEWSQQINKEGKKLSTNSETDGRFHSNWLNMMYPRLKLARNLLTNDGIIFISIDHHEHANLLRICTEIFGEANVLASVSVVNNLKGRSDDEFFATANEFMVACSRSSLDASIYGFAASEDYKAEFKFSDEISNYKEVGLRKTGKNSLRQDRPNLYYPIYYSVKDSKFSLEKKPNSIEIFPVDSNGVEGNWRWGKETFLQNKDTELVAREVGGKWNIYVKMRDVVDGEARTVRPKSIWIDPKYDTAGGSRSVKELFDGESYFENPKPVEFVKDVLRIGSRKDSIVLDFFAGSGTTAQAVMELNSSDGGDRKFILVQLPEPTPEDSDARQAGFTTISELTRKRISLAGEKVSESLLGQSVDTGFRAFSLAESNFSKWRATNEISETALEEHLLDLRESANESATIDELLTEILLKQGYPLSVEIGEMKVDDLIFNTVGENLIAAYLDIKVIPRLSQLKSVLDRKPTKFIILEDVLNGDDELKTNLMQECKSRNIEIWTV